MAEAPHDTVTNEILQLNKHQIVFIVDYYVLVLVDNVVHDDVDNVVV